MTKEQIKKIGGGDDMYKRLAVTEEYQTNPNGDGGRNFKSIHDRLMLKESMKVGSEVIVMSGTHEGLSGKIIALSAK
jgi:transcription antitermination factor NusG